MLLGNRVSLARGTGYLDHSFLLVIGILNMASLLDCVQVNGMSCKRFALGITGLTRLRLVSLVYCPHVSGATRLLILRWPVQSNETEFVRQSTACSDVPRVEHA